MSPAGRPAVFLDRDGTILDELGYLGDPDGVKLLPGAAAALARLNRAGLPALLVTNQSGVARGYFTEADLDAVHARMAELLAEEGAHLDGIYSCPHHPGAGEPPYRRECDCRKPGPGLFLQAAREHDLDPTASAVVGDAARDLEAGERAGVPLRLLVATGKGQAVWDALSPAEREGRERVDDLDAAVDRILATLVPQGR